LSPGGENSNITSPVTQLLPHLSRYITCRYIHFHLQIKQRFMIIKYVASSEWITLHSGHTMWTKGHHNGELVEHTRLFFRTVTYSRYDVHSEIVQSWHLPGGGGDFNPGTWWIRNRVRPTRPPRLAVAA
jgi:hypothetical protein